MRILGLDPGLRHTGWAVLETPSLQVIACDVMDVPCGDHLAPRLAELYRALVYVVETYSPNEAAVEEVFVNKNPTSTLRLGMARGIVMMTPAFFNIPVFEYSANKVKKTVVGAGHATKDQVIFMMERLFPKLSPLKADAADALAVALCHYQHQPMRSWSAA